MRDSFFNRFDNYSACGYLICHSVSRTSACGQRCSLLGFCNYRSSPLSEILTEMSAWYPNPVDASGIATADAAVYASKVYEKQLARISVPPHKIWTEGVEKR